jgi:hypothetical protein
MKLEVFYDNKADGPRSPQCWVLNDDGMRVELPKVVRFAVQSLGTVYASGSVIKEEKAVFHITFEHGTMTWAGQYEMLQSPPQVHQK